jgi:hypothetical protein
MEVAFDQQRFRGYFDRVALFGDLQFHVEA